VQDAIHNDLKAAELKAQEKLTSKLSFMKQATKKKTTAKQTNNNNKKKLHSIERVTWRFFEKKSL